VILIVLFVVLVVVLHLNFAVFMRVYLLLLCSPYVIPTLGVVLHCWCCSILLEFFTLPSLFLRAGCSAR